MNNKRKTRDPKGRFAFKASHSNTGDAAALKRAAKRYQATIDAVERDAVCNPNHYNQHPSGIECIKISRHMEANIASALEYMWRYKQKNGAEDLEKAIWRLADQIDLVRDLSDKPDAFGEYLKKAMKLYHKTRELHAKRA